MCLDIIPAKLKKRSAGAEDGSVALKRRNSCLIVGQQLSMTKSCLESSKYCRASNSQVLALFIESEFNALVPTTATLSVAAVVANQ